MDLSFDPAGPTKRRQRRSDSDDYDSLSQQPLQPSTSSTTISTQNPIVSLTTTTPNIIPILPPDDNTSTTTTTTTTTASTTTNTNPIVAEDLFAALAYAHQLPPSTEKTKLLTILSNPTVHTNALQIILQAINRAQGTNTTIFSDPILSSTLGLTSLQPQQSSQSQPTTQQFIQQTIESEKLRTTLERHLTTSQSRLPSRTQHSLEDKFNIMSSSSGLTNQSDELNTNPTDLQQALRIATSNTDDGNGRFAHIFKLISSLVSNQRPQQIASNAALYSNTQFTSLSNLLSNGSINDLSHEQLVQVLSKHPLMTQFLDPNARILAPISSDTIFHADQIRNINDISPQDLEEDFNQPLKSYTRVYIRGLTYFDRYIWPRIRTLLYHADLLPTTSGLLTTTRHYDIYGQPRNINKNNKDNNKDNNDDNNTTTTTNNNDETIDKLKQSDEYTLRTENDINYEHQSHNTLYYELQAQLKWRQLWLKHVDLYDKPPYSSLAYANPYHPYQIAQHLIENAIIQEFILPKKQRIYTIDYTQLPHDLQHINNNNDNSLSIQQQHKLTSLVHNELFSNNFNNNNPFQSNTDSTSTSLLNQSLSSSPHIQQLPSLSRHHIGKLINFYNFTSTQAFPTVIPYDESFSYSQHVSYMTAYYEGEMRKLIERQKQRELDAIGYELTPKLRDELHQQMKLEVDAVTRVHPLFIVNELTEMLQHHYTRMKDLTVYFNIDIKPPNGSLALNRNIFAEIDFNHLFVHCNMLGLRLLVRDQTRQIAMDDDEIKNVQQQQSSTSQTTTANVNSTTTTTMGDDDNNKDDGDDTNGNTNNGQNGTNNQNNNIENKTDTTTSTSTATSNSTTTSTDTTTTPIPLTPAQIAQQQQLATIAQLQSNFMKTQVLIYEFIDEVSYITIPCPTDTDPNATKIQTIIEHKVYPTWVNESLLSKRVSSNLSPIPSSSPLFRQDPISGIPYYPQSTQPSLMLPQELLHIYHTEGRQPPQQTPKELHEHAQSLSNAIGKESVAITGPRRDSTIHWDVPLVRWFREYPQSTALQHNHNNNSNNKWGFGGNNNTNNTNNNNQSNNNNNSTTLTTLQPSQVSILAGCKTTSSDIEMYGMNYNTKGGKLSNFGDQPITFITTSYRCIRQLNDTQNNIRDCITNFRNQQKNENKKQQLQQQQMNNAVKGNNNNNNNNTMSDDTTTDLEIDTSKLSSLHQLPKSTLTTTKNHNLYSLLYNSIENNTSFNTCVVDIQPDHYFRTLMPKIHLLDKSTQQWLNNHNNNSSSSSSSTTTTSTTQFGPSTQSSSTTADTNQKSTSTSSSQQSQPNQLLSKPILIGEQDLLQLSQLSQHIANNNKRQNGSSLLQNGKSIPKSRQNDDPTTIGNVTVEDSSFESSVIYFAKTAGNIMNNNGIPVYYNGNSSSSTTSSTTPQNPALINNNSQTKLLISPFHISTLKHKKTHLTQIPITLMINSVTNPTQYNPITLYFPAIDPRTAKLAIPQYRLNASTTTAHVLDEYYNKGYLSENNFMNIFAATQAQNYYNDHQRHQRRLTNNNNNKTVTTMGDNDDDNNNNENNNNNKKNILSNMDDNGDVSYYQRIINLVSTYQPKHVPISTLYTDNTFNNSNLSLLLLHNNRNINYNYLNHHTIESYNDTRDGYQKSFLNSYQQTFDAFLSKLFNDNGQLNIDSNGNPLYKRFSCEAGTMIIEQVIKINNNPNEIYDDNTTTGNNNNDDGNSSNTDNGDKSDNGEDNKDKDHNNNNNNQNNDTNTTTTSITTTTTTDETIVDKTNDEKVVTNDQVEVKNDDKIDTTTSTIPPPTTTTTATTTTMGDDDTSATTTTSTTEPTTTSSTSTTKKSTTTTTTTNNNNTNNKKHNSIEDIEEELSILSDSFKKHLLTDVFDTPARLQRDIRNTPQPNVSNFHLLYYAYHLDELYHTTTYSPMTTHPGIIQSPLSQMQSFQGGYFTSLSQYQLPTINTSSNNHNNNTKDDNTTTTTTTTTTNTNTTTNSIMTIPHYQLNGTTLTPPLYSMDYFTPKQKLIPLTLHEVYQQTVKSTTTTTTTISNNMMKVPKLTTIKAQQQLDESFYHGYTLSRYCNGQYIHFYHNYELPTSAASIHLPLYQPNVVSGLQSFIPQQYMQQLHPYYHAQLLQQQQLSSSSSSSSATTQSLITTTTPTPTPSSSLTTTTTVLPPPQQLMNPTTTVLQPPLQTNIQQPTLYDNTILFSQQHTHLPISVGTKTGIFMDISCLLHDYHQLALHEVPARALGVIRAIYSERLHLNPSIYFVQGMLPSLQDLLLAHGYQLVEEILNWPFNELFALEAFTTQDVDTYSAQVKVNEFTALSSLIALGGALQLCRDIIFGKAKNGFAITRPPGHHTNSHELSGFCVFGHVATIAKYATKILGLQRVLIFDWDIHYGNGTSEICRDDPSIVVINVHSSDTYPFLNDNGRTTTKIVEDKLYNGIQCGSGTNIDINIFQKYNDEITDGDYLYIFDNIILPILREYAPQLIIVSAGFDAARGDTLGTFGLTPECYAHMIAQCMLYSNNKVLACLEGGYNVHSISMASLACIKTLSGLQHTLPPLRPSLPSQSIVQAVQTTIAKNKTYWRSFGLATQSAITTAISQVQSHVQIEKSLPY